MTPKEKATELVCKYRGISIYITLADAKQCAVFYILDVLSLINDPEIRGFYNKVKTEIELL